MKAWGILGLLSLVVKYALGKLHEEQDKAVLKTKSPGLLKKE